MQKRLASLELVSLHEAGSLSVCVKARNSLEAEKCSQRPHTKFAVCGDGCTPLGDFGIRSFEGELSKKMSVVRCDLLKRSTAVRNFATGVPGLHVWQKHFINCRTVWHA